MSPAYVRTVGLLLDVVPLVFKNTCFAMKGGTAINLFVQDMPRLSVDIDVVYRDHLADREQAIAHISNELNRVRTEVLSMGFQTDLRKSKAEEELKLIVSNEDAQVKVEVNVVFRGTVLPV